MKQFSVPMALVDYIPVFLFLLAMLSITKDLNRKMNTLGGRLFEAGYALVFLAGFLKATYKLLYALKIGDFTWMSNQFFSNQAIGFLLAGCGMMMLVRHSKNVKAYAILPTIALVGIMIIGLGALEAGLCYLANKLKNRKALFAFIISFFLLLAMGYLSSKDFDKAFMNWVAQGINTLGQCLILYGARQLHASGLK